MAEKDKVIQGYQAPVYQESDAVKNAQQQLQQQIANKPGDYQSQWQGQLDSLFQQIQNRKPFQYDINTDALYQQAAQQYIQQGQKAMMDTMGQAAALTGGYGNSYAQSVGQQTYQGYLQGLYEQMPQYAQLALDRYNQEGQDMLDLYAIMGQNEDRDYNRYMDMLSAYQAELNRLQGIYDSEREFDYGKYADDRDFGYSQYINDRDYAFQLEQAEEAKRQWQAEFDEAKRQYDQNYALSVSKSSGSSGGGGGGGRSSSSGSSSGSSSWGSGISTDNGGKSSGGVTGSAWALTKNNLRQNLASGNYERAEQYLNQIIDQVNESQYKEIVDLFDKYGR